MRVVIDSAIPFIKGVLEPYAEVIYSQAQHIDSDLVGESDALIIRTRTRCNASLLASSKVKFIATATIGTDHIDLPWCEKAGITVSSAAGCNARGVLQWVAAALREATTMLRAQPQDLTLGVVGVGNVGSLVVEYAQRWGFKVLACDPPREEREGGDLCSFDKIASLSDIITLHTPLDSTTKHLINESIIQSLMPHCIILNASRGGVVDNLAVSRSKHPYIFDVWEQEPNILPDVLQGAALATPHIAGYSIQGKANATAMSVQALARHFKLPLTEWYPEGVARSTKRDISWEEMCSSIDNYFPIEEQSSQLKSTPECFESLRDNYHYREEYF